MLNNSSKWFINFRRHAAQSFKFPAIYILILLKAIKFKDWLIEDPQGSSSHFITKSSSWFRSSKGVSENGKENRLFFQSGESKFRAFSSNQSSALFRHLNKSFQRPEFTSTQFKGCKPRFHLSTATIWTIHLCKWSEQKIKFQDVCFHQRKRTCFPLILHSTLCP